MATDRPFRLRLHRGNLRRWLVVAACALARPTPAGVAAAWALVAVGGALHLWARGCLRINREVTTSGPYRFVRNPFYLANLFVDAAVCVAAGSPWLALGAVVPWALVYRAQVRREERTLEEAFGDRYRAYRARVPALLPWKGAVRGLSASAGFSLRNPSVATGKEAGRLVRFLALPLFVAGARPLALAVFGADGGHDAAAPSPSAAAAAIVLGAVLEAYAWALVRRLRFDRRAVPTCLAHPFARLGVVGAAAGVAAAHAQLAPGPTVDLEGGWRAVGLLAGACLPAIVAIGTTWASRARARVAVRWLEAGVAAAAAVALGSPWVALVALAVLGLVAIDGMERLPESETV